MLCTGLVCCAFGVVHCFGIGIVVHWFGIVVQCALVSCVEELGQEFVQLVPHKTTRRGIGISLDNSQGFNMWNIYTSHAYLNLIRGGVS